MYSNDLCMKQRVLIFDDDPDIAEVVAIILEENGFDVHHFGNCEKVKEKIRTARPDVILMDNKIPPEGGITAARQIKQSPEHGHIPVVFFSANRDVAGLANQAQADYFVEKPFDIDELVKVIGRALQK